MHSKNQKQIMTAKEKNAKTKFKKNIKIVNNCKNVENRSDGGVSTVKGVFYQHEFSIKKFLESIDNADVEYLLQEGYEDLDIIKTNNKREIYQLKYHESTKSESLTYTQSEKSGLFKVIESQWKEERNKNIDKIIYTIHGKYTEIKKRFENCEFEFVAKLFLWLHFNIVCKKHKDHDKKDTIKNDTKTNEKEYEQIIFDVTSDTQDIKNFFEINSDIIRSTINNDELYEFFTDDSMYKIYLEKISLVEGPDFIELEKDISSQIQDKFKDFFLLEQTVDYKSLKTKIVRDTIDYTFRTTLQNSKKESQRHIKVIDIINEVKKTIHTFNNKDDLLKEYICGFKNIISSMSKHDIIYRNELQNRLSILLKISVDNKNKRSIIETIVHEINLLHNRSNKEAVTTEDETYKIRYLFIPYVYETFKNIELNPDETMLMLNQLGEASKKKMFTCMNCSNTYLDKLSLKENNDPKEIKNKPLINKSKKNSTRRLNKLVDLDSMNINNNIPCEIVHKSVAIDKCEKNKKKK